MAAMRQALATFLCSDLAPLLVCLVLVGGTFGLMFAHMDVPTWLIAFDSLAVGSYFGAQVTKNAT